MMKSTKTAIVFAVLGFFLTMMVFVTAPDHVSLTSGESIHDQIKVAIAFQVFGFLCIIIAIISILVTGLKKIMSK